MGFGAIITAGDRHRPIDDQLMGWVIEARVEQKLSEATKIAFRFEDDLCDGGSELEGRAEFRPGAILGVLVKHGSELACLGFGPVTRVRSSSMVGGAGSWIEVTVSDMRETMDRTAVQATYTGKASEAAQKILDAYDFTPDCEETRKEYSTGTNALTQRATDLAFVKDIARKNNLEFWLSYQSEERGDSFEVTTTANVKSSPERPDRSAVPLGNLLPIPPILSPDAGRVIRINPPPDQCVSVGRFEAKINFDRPNAARGFAQAAGNGDSSEQSSGAPEPALDSDAAPIANWTDSTRTILAPAATTEPLDQFLAQEAELSEASWFVEVDGSGTLEQLGFIVEPHQVVDVEYAGPRLSGPYQVMSTLHVINAVDHYIDFKLRANGLREGGAS
jgi:hypothetical protein